MIQLLVCPASKQNFVHAVHSVCWPLLMGVPAVQELQEARPQLLVPQGSLDVQEAVNPQYPGDGLSSDGGSLSSHDGSLSGHDSSLSRHNSSLSSNTGRSSSQAGELVSDMKRVADKGWAVNSSTDVPNRTTGGFASDSAGSTRGDNNLISGGGASTSANSESVCEASTTADSITGSSSLTSTISESINDGSSYTDGDSELDGRAASSNSSSSSSTGFSSVNTGLAVATHSSTGVPSWRTESICRGMNADSIKASWPHSARQSAILASEHLSSRCVASLLFFQRFCKGFSKENVQKHRKGQKTAPLLRKPALCWLPCAVIAGDLFPCTLP